LGSLFGSPEEAEELLQAALALRFQRREVGRSRGRGAERPYFWAAAIRFSLKYLFNQSVFGVFQPTNNSFPIRFDPK
jgi:hypothetical protein